jgi:hypothetical protein
MKHLRTALMKYTGNFVNDFCVFFCFAVVLDPR